MALTAEIIGVSQLLGTNAWYAAPKSTPMVPGIWASDPYDLITRFSCCCQHTITVALFCGNMNGISVQCKSVLKGALFICN